MNAAGGRIRRAPAARVRLLSAQRGLLPKSVSDVSRKPSHYASIGKQVLVNPSQPPEQH